MSNGDGGYKQQQRAAGLTVQVGWPGLRVGNHFVVLFYIHQMNRLNSRNDYVMMTAPRTLLLVPS